MERDGENGRNTARKEREVRGEEENTGFGKVPHHTGCPADTTNSPACVGGGEGLLNEGPLILNLASSSGLDPLSPHP